MVTIRSSSLFQVSCTLHQYCIPPLHYLKKWHLAKEVLSYNRNIIRVFQPELASGKNSLVLMKKVYVNSGGSRHVQNVDQVLSQKNLSENEVFVHFHSNLEILTVFQKACDPVWIRHW